MARSLFILCFFMCYLNFDAQNLPLYVGTYTNGDSEGIYQLQFNTKTGELKNLKLAAEIENPSFITYSPDKQHIYAVSESLGGTVSAFKVQPSGSLQFLNKLSSNGTAPCHIATNQTGDKAVVSNYGGGSASVYTISKDGRLLNTFQTFNFNTLDKISHAHSAQFLKDELFIADLGTNAVYQYILKNDKYVLETPNLVAMPGNPGSRHFVITKNGQYIYVINEYGGSVTSIKRTSNGFEQIDFDNTLDENYRGKNSCADIHLSKNEDYLYGSNRGENSIVVFSRNKRDGTLEKIQTVPVRGDWPRNFTLDPTGKFLLVANQNSNNISVFNIDSSSGKLTFLQSIKAPSPVCLLF